MPRNPSRTVDKTYLSLDLAEERGLIHRDYIAHCLRWSHVARHLQRSGRFKDAIVLDVGCGKELPLAKLLYVNKMTPLHYVGVDMNEFGIPEMLQGKKLPIQLWKKTDFCDLDMEDVGLKIIDRDDPAGPGYDDYALPNIVVSFEVLEHMTPAHCRRTMEHMKEVTAPDCHYFISTPCYNGSAAGNHVSEVTYGALGGLFEDLGYHIEGVYGTFASISDYESSLGDVATYDRATGEVAARTDLRPIFNALRNYYDTNVLSIIFAPLFPDKSRNCLWHLTKKQGIAADQDRLFSALEQVPQPWGQHPDYLTLAGPAEVEK